MSLDRLITKFGENLVAGRKLLWRLRTNLAGNLLLTVAICAAISWLIASILFGETTTSQRIFYTLGLGGFVLTLRDLTKGRFALEDMPKDHKKALADTEEGLARLKEER